MRTCLAILLLPVALSADPVITSAVSCAVPSADGPITSSSNPCDTESDFLIGDPASGYIHQYARASVTTQYALNADGFSFQTFTHATATPSGDATAKATFTDTYHSDGPVRQGFLSGIFFSG